MATPSSCPSSTPLASGPAHSPDRARPAAARGFSLIEAIAAIVIAAVAVPAMLWAVRDAQVRRVEPVMFDRARWLAAERLEQVIADRHSATRGYAYLVGANYPEESPVSDFPGFSRSVSITETDESLSGGGTGYKTVRVTISWPAGAGGSPRTFSLSTVLAELTAP